MYIRPLAKAAFFSAVATSFTGALTAGLGQGFDLGTQWPGNAVALVLKAVEGSFEPVHRFFTVATGVLYLLVFLAAWRVGGRLRLVAALALASLAATALTGRVVLQVLGGEVPPPISYVVYPLNNFFALATALLMALLASLLEPRRYKARLAFFYRGAAFWGAVASVSGAYILGYHKIVKAPLAYSLWPPSWDLAWLIHLAAALLAVAFSLVALASGFSPSLWHILLALSIVVQPLTGLLMFYGASADPWAPGPQTAFHGAFAHLLVVSAFVLYLKSR